MLRASPITKLAVAQTIIWAGTFYLFPALLLRWEHALSVERDILTALFTAALLLTAIFSPLAGRWIDKGLGPYVLAGSAAIAGVAICALSIANSLSTFALIWSIVGICMAAALYDPCFAMVTRARGDQSRSAITKITLFAGFAGTISFPLSHILSDFFDWTSSALVFGVLILFLAAPLTWSASKHLEREAKSKETPHQRQDQGRNAAYPNRGGVVELPVAKTMRSAPFLYISGAFAMMALIHGMVVSHFLPMLDAQGVNPGLAVVLISCIGPLQVVGRILMMSIGKNFSTGILIIVSFFTVCIAQAILLVALFLDAKSAHETMGLFITSCLLVFVILQGAAYGVTSILRASVTRELLGDANFGTIAGGVTLASFLATAAAPYVGTILWRFWGYEFLTSCAIVFSIIGIICFFFADKQARREERFP